MNGIICLKILNYDEYFLFFSTDKQRENFEIIGFYSFDVNELELEKNKNISFVSFDKYDFEEVKEYLENGKTLKDWLKEVFGKYKNFEDIIF